MAATRPRLARINSRRPGTLLSLEPILHRVDTTPHSPEPSPPQQDTLLKPEDTLLKPEDTQRPRVEDSLRRLEDTPPLSPGHTLTCLLQVDGVAIPALEHRAEGCHRVTQESQRQDSSPCRRIPELQSQTQACPGMEEASRPDQLHPLLPSTGVFVGP